MFLLQNIDDHYTHGLFSSIHTLMDYVKKDTKEWGVPGEPMLFQVSKVVEVDKPFEDDDCITVAITVYDDKVTASSKQSTLDVWIKWRGDNYVTDNEELIPPESI